MKSYLVTISRGASYTPIIESVIAESQMQAMNHVIKKTSTKLYFIYKCN